jgi:hypothetical protein
MSDFIDEQSLIYLCSACYDPLATDNTQSLKLAIIEGIDVFLCFVRKRTILFHLIYRVIYQRTDILRALSRAQNSSHVLDFGHQQLRRLKSGELETQ